MPHYSGLELAVWLDSSATDLSGTARSVDVEAVAAAPESIDVTTAGDDSRQIIAADSGAPETAVTIASVVEGGMGGAGLSGQAIGTSGTLYVFPRGAYRGREMITVSDATLHEAEQDEPYDNAVLNDTKWKAIGAPTQGLYEGPGGDPANGRIIIEAADGANTAESEIYLCTGTAARQWPCVVFLPTGFLDFNPAKYLTTAQCQALGAVGWDISGHGDTTGMAWSDYGGDADAYEADVLDCKNKLLALATPGSDMFGPPGDDIDATSQARILNHFTWIACGATNPYAVYPNAYTWAWRGCADAGATLAQIQTAIDLCIGDPDRVLVLGWHRIVGTETYVDQDSAAGTAFLYVADTMHLTSGDSVTVNQGGPREETCDISGTGIGIGYNLAANLTFSHTALQADIVAYTPVGVTASRQRLEAVLDYLETKSITILTFTDLAAL